MKTESTLSVVESLLQKILAELPLGKFVTLSVVQCHSYNAMQAFLRCKGTDGEDYEYLRSIAMEELHMNSLSSSESMVHIVKNMIDGLSRDMAAKGVQMVPQGCAVMKVPDRQQFWPNYKNNYCSGNMDMIGGVPPIRTRDQARMAEKQAELAPTFKGVPIVLDKMAGDLCKKLEKQAESKPIVEFPKPKRAGLRDVAKLIGSAAKRKLRREMAKPSPKPFLIKKEPDHATV